MCQHGSQGYGCFNFTSRPVDVLAGDELYFYIRSSVANDVVQNSDRTNFTVLYASFSEEISTGGSTIDTIEQRVANIESDQLVQDKNIQTIQKNVQENTEKIIINETKITELETEKQELQEDLDALSILGQAEGESIDLNDSSDARFKNFEIEGNSKQDGEPSIESPVDIDAVGDNGSINEVICGKNIFDSSIFSETTLNGVTIKRNDNGTITLNGTYQGSSSSQYRINMNHFPKKIAGKMSMKVISGTVSGGEVRFMLWDDNWNNKWVSPENTIYSTLSESTVYTKASITIYSGAICNNLVIGLQIEKGTTATEYEEYKEQVISVPVQQAMRAIGTVKDCFIVKEDGKRYERHNIARIESYNGEVINTEYMSTTGELSTGATVDYVLETPNDLECTSEQNTELDKLENLRSYKNITHIYSTDEVGAYVKVEYRKDLETYIMNNIQSSLETQTQNTISTIEEEGQE